MVRILVEGHEAVARTARSIFPLADKAGDEPTADLLTQRLTVHEQTAWMFALAAGNLSPHWNPRLDAKRQRRHKAEEQQDADGDEIERDQLDDDLAHLDLGD